MESLPNEAWVEAEGWALFREQKDWQGLGLTVGGAISAWACSFEHLANYSQLLNAFNGSQLLTIVPNCLLPLPTAHNCSELLTTAFNC